MTPNATTRTALTARVEVRTADLRLLLLGLLLIPTGEPAI
jgi:hypothetical protein